MKSLHSYIEKLRSIDKSEKNSYDLICEILNSVGHIYFIGTLTKGSFLHRSRLHDEDNLDFENIEQLSYRKDIDNICEFGRANKPKQSIFYCADRDYIALYETSKIIRNYPNEKCEFEIITTGKWEVKQDLDYVLIWNSQNAIDRNELVKEHNKKIDEIIKNRFGDSDKEVYAFLSFLSNEFTKKTDDFNDYKISCAFSNIFYMRDDLGFNIDGISYPSAQSNEYGINHAFFPEKIKNKIELVSANRQTLIRNGDKKYIEIENKQSKKIENGKIYWTDSIKLNCNPSWLHL